MYIPPCINLAVSALMDHTQSRTKKRDLAVEDSTPHLVIWYKMGLTDRCIPGHSIKGQLSSVL